MFGRIVAPACVVALSSPDGRAQRLRLALSRFHSSRLRSTRNSRYDTSSASNLWRHPDSHRSSRFRLISDCSLELRWRF